MGERGLTLHLSSSHGCTDDSLSAWIDQLADVPGDRRLVVSTAVDLAAAVVACAPRGIEVKAADAGPTLWGFGFTIVADAGDRPGAHLIARLLDSVIRAPGTIHSARVIPLEAEPDQPQPACLALSEESLRRLKFDLPPDVDFAPEVHRAASRAGLPMAESSAAVVVRDVQVNRTGEGSSVVVSRRDVADPVEPRLRAPMPTGHPASLSGTSVGRLFSDLGLPAPDVDASDHPFLTVVTRTQGVRLQCLSEVFDCLAAQTLRDFEVILACHRVEEGHLARVHGIVESLPMWLRQSIRIIEVTRLGRAAPLNEALDVASGRYAVVLDDDDTVLSEWVETFASLELERPGAVLRTGAVRQDTARHDVIASSESVSCPVPVTAPAADWPEDFSLVSHLHGNYSPCMTVAFPRGYFRHLGQRYDESLPTTEDWHFLVRAAAVVGVVNSLRITSVYRWWVDGGQSSRDVHDEAEWARGRAFVLDHLDSRLMLLPPSSVSELEDVRSEAARAWSEVTQAAEASARLNDRLVDALRANAALNTRLINTLESNGRQALVIRKLQARLADRAHTVRALRARLKTMKSSHESYKRLLKRIYGDTSPSGAPDVDGAAVMSLGRPGLRSLADRIESATSARHPRVTHLGWLRSRRGA